MKEIEDDTNKQKAILCIWTGRINIVKISTLPKVIYRFNAIPIKTPMAFFLQKHKKTLLKFIWSCKKHQIAKAIVRKKNKAGGVTFPNFKLYYTAITSKTVWYWQKKNKTKQKKPDKQTNGTEFSLDINSSIFGQLIFNNGANKTQLCNRQSAINFAVITLYLYVK